MSDMPIKVYNATGGWDMSRAWHAVKSLDDARRGIFTVFVDKQEFQLTVQQKQIVVHVGGKP